jgi:hypothetical protein
MRQTLLHGLFPLVRTEVLQLLFANPKQELYVRELARLSHLSLQTVQDEMAKLDAADLILSRSNGYQRFDCANSQHPIYATLRKLVARAALHRKPVARARGQRKRTRRQRFASGWSERAGKIHLHALGVAALVPSQIVVNLTALCGRVSGQRATETDAR